MYKIVTILLFHSLLLFASEPIVIPQSLLDEVDNGNAEIAYFIATRFNQRSYLEPESDNFQKAQKWMKIAAEMKYPQAMYEFGEMLELEGKEQDALQWYKNAAEYGHSDAIEHIALYYILGMGGLDEDCQEAYRWYKRAESTENKLAYNDHAWSLATSADAECRSPEKALRLISELMTLYRSESGSIPYAVLDTKAAVHASISDFNKAIEIQKHVMKLLGKDHSKYADFQLRLDSYLQRKVWRQKKEQ